VEIIEKDDSVEFRVRVVARASKNEIVGIHDGALKVRIASAPLEGAANAALVKLLAKQFGVSRSAIDIVSGEASKSKRIRISNMTKLRIEEAIG
jgi:uncharacterized protein (TIGR00251 family)